MIDLLRTSHYIDGQWRVSAETYAVCNPATGEVIANVARGGAKETQLAIDAARKALPAWRALTAKERGARVKRWGELMVAHREALGTLLTREQGKPLVEAFGEVAYAASFFEWFAEEAKRAYGDVIPSPKPNSKIIVTREPVGVVAAITPWNFPLAMITRKAGPALAAGCTMVLKPSEETPLSAFALAVLAEEAGIPPGVFNIVSGDAPAIGATLTQSDDVRKLSFTGSTRVGKLLARQSADTLKKLSLELGGNAPFIVFDDADIDAAVEGAIASKFRNTGQTCVCVNRFYVQNGVYDAFTQALTRAVQKLRVGNGLLGAFEQGPLINEAALKKVLAHVDDALHKGAKVLPAHPRRARRGPDRACKSTRPGRRACRWRRGSRPLRYRSGSTPRPARRSLHRRSAWKAWRRPARSAHRTCRRAHAACRRKAAWSASTRESSRRKLRPSAA
jgi:succinate-semialdehyde dehydrogenase/glutarate-semialdehyde dehydrogenase